MLLDLWISYMNYLPYCDEKFDYLNRVIDMCIANGSRVTGFLVLRT